MSVATITRVFPALKFRQGALARRLRLVAVDRVATDTGLRHDPRDAVGAVLRAREDQHRTAVVLFQRRDQGLLLFGFLHVAEPLLDRIDHRCHRFDGDAHGIVLGRSAANRSIVLGIVAEKSNVWRCPGSNGSKRRMSWMNPMSSIRSASSSTKNSICFNEICPCPIKSSRRPGVAVSTSTPRFSSRSADAGSRRRKRRRYAAACTWRSRRATRRSATPVRAWA